MLNSLTIELDKKFPSPPCLCFLARRWRGMCSSDMTERKTHLSNALLHAQLNCVPFCIRVWWRSNLSTACAHTHICVWQASLWDIHTHTHGPLLVCYLEKERGFGIMSLFHHDSVPESLSSAVWGKAMCAALTDVDSQHAQTQTHTLARFFMHEERPLGPDWTAHIHCSVHPCPFHSHSRMARHTHKLPCTKTHTYNAVMNVEPSWHVCARWEKPQLWACLCSHSIGGCGFMG